MPSRAEIEAFVAAARHGGVTRAAELLHRSQPAISRRIGQLEAALGAPLLDRGAGSPTLTEAGRVFLPHAEAALAALKDGAAAVAGLEDETGGGIGLAIVGTLADSLVIAVLQDFLRRRPDVELDLRTATSAEVSELVRRGEVALGLRYDPPPTGDLTAHEVGREPLQLVCAADHRLAGRRLRRLDPLAGERWLVFPTTRSRPNTALQHAERTLAKAGLHDIERMVVDSLNAQKRLVEAGFGIALMPESAVRDELARGSLAAIDGPGLRLTQTVAAVCRRTGYLNGAARALLDELLAAKDRPISAPSPTSGRRRRP
ncbi:MAG: LysR family transcriptional regulator [Minwuia sp.]|uniref:LysR family transcriptional regulator n=1 Tax=Minwuia sp. TaxID=2493630 RepID=UPI003A8B79AB